MRIFFKYPLYFLLFLFLLSLFYLYFSNPLANNPRFQSTGLNDRFNFTGTNFADYIQQTKIMIKNARIKAGAPSDSTTVDENTPFELLPDPKVCGKNTTHHYENGILLVHGLGDSPYGMRTLGRYFQSRCFLVRAILLPGMGTTPGDLTKVNYHQWIKAAQFGANTFNSEVNNFYLGGFSLGGVVVSAIVPTSKNLKGVILFSPAFEINSPLNFTIEPLYELNHIFSRLAWGNTYPENNPNKYNSFPLNGIDQLYVLSKKVTDEKNNTLFNHTPIFVVQSYVDDTVKTKKTLSQFNYNQNPLSGFILFKNSPYKTQDKRILVYPDAYPPDNFLDLSHYAVIFSRNDPLYGFDGKLRDCLHYPVNSDDWKKCQTLPDNLKGETTKTNLEKGILQRSSYNPFLNEVFLALDTFLKNTQK